MEIAFDEQSCPFDSHDFTNGDGLDFNDTEDAEGLERQRSGALFAFGIFGFPRNLYMMFMLIFIHFHHHCFNFQDPTSTSMWWISGMLGALPDPGPSEVS